MSPELQAKLTYIIAIAGPYLIIVLAALYTLALSVNVSMSRGKHGIKAPATVGHDGFERAFRAHLNMVENFMVFLPIFLVNIQFPNVSLTKIAPLAVPALGLTWLLCRIISGLNYIKNWNKGLGYAAYGIALLCILALAANVLSGMYLGIAEVLNTSTNATTNVSR